MDATRGHLTLAMSYLRRIHSTSNRTMFWPSELVAAGVCPDDDAANEAMCDLEAAGLVSAEAVVWCAAGHMVTVVTLDEIEDGTPKVACAECGEADDGRRNVMITFELTDAGLAEIGREMAA